MNEYTKQNDVLQMENQELKNKICLLETEVSPQVPHFVFNGDNITWRKKQIDTFIAIQKNYIKKELIKFGLLSFHRRNFRN